MSGERWRYCPECGFVGLTKASVCEINGAGATMVDLPEVVARELIELGNALGEDDGTWLRIGPVAVGKVLRGLSAGRWFVKRWSGGHEVRTGFGGNPLQAFKRAMR